MPEDAGAAPAGGHRPAPRHRGHDDHRRPRAHGRPGRGDRRAGHPAGPAAALPHPREPPEDDRPDHHHGPPVARLLRQPRRPPGPGGAPARRRGRRLQRGDHRRAGRHHEDLAGADRAGPVAVLGHPPPGAHRRPRHQYRRGCRLPGRGRDRTPPPQRLPGERLVTAASATRTPAPQSPGIQPAMANMRILIIEDERGLCDSLTYNLQREGYETTVAHDGQEGLRKAQTLLPDLILLDLMLPVLKGEDVLRELRGGERTRDIPVIVLTAKAEETDQIVSYSLGCDDYVIKP